MIIEKTDFKSAVDAVTPFARAKSTLPILSHVKIESNGKKLTFTASHIDSQIEYWINVEAEKFAVCVDAVALKKFAQFCDSDVSLAIKGKKAVLEFGDTKTRLNTLEAQDFPMMTKSENVITEIEWEPLGSKIAFASQFCGINPSQPQLQCVQVNSTGETIEVFATDGKSLGVQTLNHIAPAFGICIPVDTARHMTGAFKTLTVREEQIELRGPNAIALFKTSPYKPMAIRPVITKKLPNSGSVARESLSEAISFVSSFCDSGKVRGMVRIESGESNVVSLVGLENEATAPFQYEGEPFVFGAYYEDFIAFLKALSGDKLTFEFDKKDMATTQIRLTDGDRLICTMPARI
jgi:DNA polymerase III sliding clamp (beta) subunit (PCNA family)